MLLVAPGPAHAATPATVALSGEDIRIGGTVTVTVTDPGASTAQVNAAETVGSTAYSIPIASAGDSFVFQTLNPLLMDANDDGVVSATDITLSISNAVPISVVPVNGVFTLQLTTPVTSPTTFAVTYRSERVDTLPVKITSTSDTTGFSLTLRETLADSGVFTGTFETGAATVATNATDPAATARPDIKVVDKDLVTASYTDAEPLSLVADRIRVDGVAPTVTQLSPMHNVFEQTFSSFFEARITDIDSGVDTSSVKFHLDEDGDATYTEPGTILLPDPAMTSVKTDGVIVRVRIPSTAPDGLRSWYVTASDIAGGTGRSDADPATGGNQNHVFTSDQNPPQVVTAVAGEWYDTVSKTIKTGNRTTVHVVFNEKISVPSVVVGGFRLNGVPAVSVQTHSVLPNDLFLTVDSYPTVGPVVLLIDPGSVTDLSGIATALVPVTVTDEVPPDLKITFDRTATNSLVAIGVTSDENLAATPSITVNGLTRGVPVKVGEREWELVFNVATLSGADAGEGAKTVGAFGFDTANTLGVATSTAFELDTTVSSPTLTPTGLEVVTEAFPLITAYYAAEAGEYVGDTHNGVSLILATMDGVQVAPFMSTVDGGSTWTLKAADVYPDGYEDGIHIFEITAVDVAGNVHPLTPTVFEVKVPPPAPEPVVEPVVDEIVGDATEDVPVDDGQPVEDATTPDEIVEVIEPDPVDSTLPSESTTDDAVDGDGNPVAVPEVPPESEPVTEVLTTEDLSEAVIAVEDAVEVASEDPVVAPVEAEVVPDASEEAALAGESAATEVSDSANPNVDPVFDREAELAALDGEDAGSESSTLESGGAIFGCNLPLGNTNVVGGEYALLGVGLLGLGLRRPAGALRELLFPSGDESGSESDD